MSLDHSIDGSKYVGIAGSEWIGGMWHQRQAGSPGPCLETLRLCVRLSWATSDKLLATVAPSFHRAM